MIAPHSVVVLGTAGGVGATTATAMIVAGIAASTGRIARLSDRTGGLLAARVPSTLASLPSDASIGIHDLGHHVTDAALADLLAARHLLVVATAASIRGEKSGAQLAHRALQLVDGIKGVPSPLIVATQVFGRETNVPAARNAQFRVHAIPWDRALAAGGQIDVDDLGQSTSAAFDALVVAVQRSLDSANPR